MRHAFPPASGLAIALLCAIATPAQVIPSETRFGTLPYIRTHFALPKYRSLAQWTERNARLREQILTAAGLSPMPNRGDLNVQRHGRVERGTYAVEKITIETLSGFFLAGNLYLPLNKPGKHPGVLLPHGHWKHGRAEDIPTYSVPALGANLADQGYVAFAYDMLGYNDTRQLPHDFGDSSTEHLWSFGPLGVQLWNSIRALDFLESLPNVDKSKLAVTGASGGGTQTFLLTAVDQRIRVSAPVNMVSGTMQGSSPCENAPGLRIGTSNIELAALAAPRPMLLVSTTRDWTKNTPKEEYPQIRQIYDLYGARDALAFVQFPTEHNYDRASRESVYAFFRRHLLGSDGAAVTETVVPALEKSDLLLGDEFQPVGALTEEQIFASWQRMSEEQSDALSTAEKTRRLAATLGAEWPDQLRVSKSREAFIINRPDHDDRLRVRWLKGTTSEVVIALHPDGGEAARYLPEVIEARHRGASVLLVDVFGVGTSKANKYGGGRHFLTYNRSVDAHRVQDVLTAVAFAASENRGKMTLVGYHSAAAWCVLAIAMLPEGMTIALDTPGASERELKHSVFIPGLFRAGGLETAATIAEQRTGTYLAIFHSEPRAQARR